MNFLKIIEQFDFDKTHPELHDNATSRKDALNLLGKFASGVALAAVPTILMTLPKAVAAQGAGVTEILNYALVLEYLESEFYNIGLSSGNLIPSKDRTVIQTIAKHEAAHVNYLKTALGSAAGAKPTFDFTVGGAFSPFTDYPTFLIFAQAFEDTGIRAYKGQAPALMVDPATLQVALQIHSVEARHASEIRRIRGQKGWVTGDNAAANGIPSTAFDAVYAGENQSIQGGVNVPNVSGISSAAVAESFDEFITMDQGNAIAGLFIK
ncbi:MAG: ferritin-like domain-containing protein [Bacteroidota bacterium]|nr:ferritin-like domain-containing protein [Bacteroidota bacterium]